MQWQASVSDNSNTKLYLVSFKDYSCRGLEGEGSKKVAAFDFVSYCYMPNLLVPTPAAGLTESPYRSKLCVPGWHTGTAKKRSTLAQGRERLDSVQQDSPRQTAGACQGRL